MFSTHIDVRLLPMKLHYVLYMGEPTPFSASMLHVSSDAQKPHPKFDEPCRDACRAGVAFVQGFAPTIAKQLGYTPMVVGSLYTYLSVLALLVKPLSGLVVDKYPVKRATFLGAVLSCGVTAFALNLARPLPTEPAVAGLRCDATAAYLDVRVDDGGQHERPTKNDNELVDCRLSCQYDKLFWDEMCNSWKIIDFCTIPNNTFEKDEVGYLNVSLFIDMSDWVEENYIFQVQLVQIKETQIVMPACHTPFNISCEVNCSNNILAAATLPRFRGNVFKYHQFWVYLIIMSLFWISQAIAWNLQDPICFDLLGDKPENFGKQRCWGSISWGFFSILGGAIVDYFSEDDLHKNYVPIYYLCLVIILCDFAVASKIEVTETVGSKNTSIDVLKLIKKFNVIVYFIWIVVLGICTSMIWDYIAWYMEDITTLYHGDKQPWIKTLQGSASAIECFSEVPFLFFSGWIIKRVGHWHCMSLGLFVFAARFYAYSVITDPVWILPVEMTNGITFGLCHAVLIAYARSVAPASAANTVVGIAGALYEGIGTSLGGFLGGFLYQTYGGAWTFKLFAYGSLSMGIIHVLITKFSWTYLQNLISQMNMKYRNLSKS